MRKLIYILLLLLLKGTIGVASSIVAMEQTIKSADGCGYKNNIISYDADCKYPIQQVVEIYKINFSGTKTNLVKKAKFVGDHIIVKLKDGVTVDQLKIFNRKNGAFIRRKLLTKNTFLIGVDTVHINAVNNLTDVYNAATDIIEYAEPDYMIELQDTIPNDPYYLSHQWDKDKIKCPAAWDLATNADNVIIAVIDTGVDYNHPDLASNIWVNPGESGIDSNGVNMATNGIDDDANGFIDDVHGWDFHYDDNDPIDGHGHGTRCSGHAGAIGNNGIGVAGVCWNVKVMALKLYNDAGTIAHTSDAIDCFEYVSMMREKGINVRLTSNSWIADYSSGLENAIKDNRDHGVLCVAAAGNAVGDIDQNPVYPACFNLDNVISVTGTDVNDNLYRPDVAVGLINVDLSAPAKDLVCTSLNGGYGTGSGTSYATPMVAGAAALIWEKAPNLTHQEVMEVIMDGVDQVSSMQGNSVSGGRLNVYKSLLKIPSGGIIYIK